MPLNRCDRCGAFKGHKTSCRHYVDPVTRRTPFENGSANGIERVSETLSEGLAKPFEKGSKASGNGDAAMEAWVNGRPVEHEGKPVMRHGWKAEAEALGIFDIPGGHMTDAQIASRAANGEADPACASAVTNAQGIGNHRAETAAGFAPGEKAEVIARQLAVVQQLERPNPLPDDLPGLLRELAYRCERGEVVGVVLGYATRDGDYVIQRSGDNAAVNLTLASILFHRSCHAFQEPA